MRAVVVGVATGLEGDGVTIRVGVSGAMGATVATVGVGNGATGADRRVETWLGAGGAIPCNSNFFRSNWAIKVCSNEIVSATSDAELVRR
jgi:hypothetical protein